MPEAHGDIVKLAYRFPVYSYELIDEAPPYDDTSGREP